VNGGPTRHVLDADVFMEAARRYYAFDIAPGFWQALIRHARAGTVLSVDRVKTEIDRGNDDLKNWSNSDFQSWFAATEVDDVMDAYRRIMEWASNQRQFTEAAKAEFARGDNADAWVVAHALAKGCVVVTHEQFQRESRSRILIPNVCRAFSVQYLDTFQMLRALGVKLA